jgi:hypothetical protein
MMVAAMMTMISPNNHYLGHERLQDRHARSGKKYRAIKRFMICSPGMKKALDTPNRRLTHT